MLRRQPSRIELKPEDKDEVRLPLPLRALAASPPRPLGPPSTPPPRGFPPCVTDRRPSFRSLFAQYEEARKAHIRRLQADLARGHSEGIVANSFQFNPSEPTKEERIGLDQ